MTKSTKLATFRDVISNFKGISYHMYADDLQLYFSFNPDSINETLVLHDCRNVIKDWMATNSLQLNAAKTALSANVHPHP